MTFLELAQKVLEESDTPLSSMEIWKIAVEKNYTQYLESQGKTPSATLGSQLYSRAKKQVHQWIGWNGSRPVKFFIKGRGYSQDLFDFSNGSEEDTIVSGLKFKEADLHPLLAYYIREDLYSYPKTIKHNVSKRARYRQWEHPDMVACNFPEGFWSSKAYALASKLGQEELEIYSFEIKKSLSFSNLRESFFQTVSNSSWANKSYLVAAEISKDVEFLMELSRLCESFGIGIIELDINDPDNSDTFIEPKERKDIDWTMVDKLCGNKDFAEFIDRVTKDLHSKDVRDEWYDKVWDKEDLIKKFR